jgi:integrase
MEGATWTIPGARMKAGRDHRVPLSPAALALLRKLQPRTGGFVFPGGKKGQPLTTAAMLKALRAVRTGFDAHGFRSTFRDWCSEYGKNAFAREVCEHALAHGLPDKVEAAYRRGDLLEKRVALMQAWADYCGGVE